VVSVGCLGLIWWGFRAVRRGARRMFRQEPAV
jgi:hypothetical protein